MGDNKDNNYNDTNKKEDPLAPKSSVCGFISVPGVQYASTIVCTMCPSCKTVGPTKVDSAWNIKSYVCCYYCGPCWWCYQTLKGKDYTLKDGYHACSTCNAEIMDYKSCE
jgi:hypothetical protein